MGFIRSAEADVQDVLDSDATGEVRQGHALRQIQRVLRVRQIPDASVTRSSTRLTITLHGKTIRHTLKPSTETRPAHRRHAARMAERQRLSDASPSE